jgi:parallel beta-helix repeat protein
MILLAFSMSPMHPAGVVTQGAAPISITTPELVFNTTNVTVNYQIDQWVPWIPMSGQVELYYRKSDFTSYVDVYVELPSTGYKVSSWGTPTIVRNNITVNAESWHWTGVSLPVVLYDSHTYDLGILPAGNYFFNFSVWGSPVKDITFSLARCARNINTGLNYSTIQAAIDAPETLDGHTLRCDAGNYTENVHVYKSLKIIGAGPTLALSIPFEPSDTFSVTASDVTIEGFTVQSVSGYSAVRLDKADNCKLSNNTITGEGGGITLSNSSDNTVANNVILSLPGNGIWITDSSQRNTIVENSLNLDHYGIVLLNASNYNVVEDNFVNSSTWDGIRLNWQGSNYAPVAFNNITNNIICHNYDGIFLDYPSNNNLVSDNMASDNYIGIRLRQTNSSTVVRNTVISNSYRGISAESSYANTIDDNFLNNTSNAWDDGKNDWNMTYQTGSNIIGGPYMGGNYWSDNPNPADADGDGIGDTAYNVAGGTNLDHLPLVTEQPIFIASCMTPEREPYPFDILCISNGTWRREFTNVTHVVTQAPTNATYTLRYSWKGDEMLYRIRLAIPLGESREFDFYALDLEEIFTVGLRVRPYILFQEVGANASLSWNWDPASLTLNWTLIHSRHVAIDVTIDDNTNETPNYTAESDCEHEMDTLVITPTRTYTETNCLDEYYSNENTTSTSSIVFREIDPAFGTIMVTGLWRDSRIDILKTLRNLEGVEYPSQSLIPLYVVPQGNYILECIAEEYVPLQLPLNVESGKGTIFDTYLQKTADLELYAFSIIAENPFAESSYSGLTHSPANKTIKVNVDTETIHDWWGCFVLPKDRMVRTLTAYSGNASYRLRELYNYTEQTVGNYTIVAVRIPPEIDHLTLNYIVSVNNNAIMDVAPLKTVVGQGYSANINVTVYDGVPAEPMNITLYANQTIIGTLTNVTLACGNCTTITFPWNTTSFAKGNYAICACAWPVPGETDDSDNNFTMYAVKITIPGDINGDFTVDIYDALTLAGAYNSKPNSPNWNLNADINGDNMVDIYDAIILAGNFNKRVP